MKKQTKADRYKLEEQRKKAIEESLKGSGRYVFRNKNSGDLILLKPGLDGKVSIAPNETWEGDSFFLKYVIEHEATLVRVIEEPKMNEEKLILDQPDQFTSEGKVEHVVVKKETKPLNESDVDEKEKNEKKEILLTEDPLEGVQILND